MESNLKSSYMTEIIYQKRMLNNLQRWIKWSFVLSSLALLMIYFGSSINPLLNIFGIIIMIVTLVCMILLGLAIKNGRSNLLKIVNSLEKKQMKK